MIKSKTYTNINDFEGLILKLASPERIKEWSFGEVTKPETINYRTQRSERSGLFDEKIFGPDKDYECYCGKYRGIRYKGIICEKCGVEITRSIVRRERMGHIELATPVSHVWFLKSTPSRIGMILGISASDLEKVIYFAGYIVTGVMEDERKKVLSDLDAEFKLKLKSAGKEEEKNALKELWLKTKREIEDIKEGQVLDEVLYHNHSLRYGTIFEAGIGAEAIYKILKDVDLVKLKVNLEKDLEVAGAAEKEKIAKRISLAKSMIASGVRPEWTFLLRLPVIPPALRPMVPLDGGRYATSDVNDLYRRVINRNNRLKKLKEINAPEVILRNEKRILQEAVDALIDNTLRQGTTQIVASQAQKRALKSLADNLKGKRGFFRQNLLGKRVDYSGRSVIVIGPTLKLNECGLPKHMALELFRPFVIHKILKMDLAYNIKGASKLIEEGVPEVWAILEEVIKDKYVLLNRAPTLHRLGIQAFKPLLIEGNAIQIHPLVCTAFNADFDGDQMAVHVPLGEEAQLEAKEILAADKNILKPGSGDAIITAKMLDIILGCYWMTKVLTGEKGEGKYFSNPNSAITTFDFGELGFRAKIKILATDTPKYKEFQNGIFETSVGRLLFNSVLPSDYPFVNAEIDRKKMASLIEDLIERYGIEKIPDIVDKVKNFGFQYATYAGITWGIDEVKIPEAKGPIIKEAHRKVEEIVSQYNDGFISTDERLRKNIEIWHWAKSEIEKIIPSSLDPRGSVHDMVNSGARGSLSQITQMAGIKGLIQNTAGETIEFPVVSSTKEGLTPIEYFITTHGARKGLTDTALNTAKAGYLTRRLFDVAQDSIISEEDCGTKDGIKIVRKSSSDMEIPLSRNIRWRFLAEDLVLTNGTVFKKGAFISKKEAVLIDSDGVKEVTVRSPLSCKSIKGICGICYGADLGNGRPIEIGEAIGTVAAQAIGEPGTQLTMRTFHTGGTASVGGDITTGLPRVEEVFEKRKPKNAAVISRVDGIISEIKEDKGERYIIISGEGVKKPKKGDSEYAVSFHRSIIVKAGQAVKKGQILTDGSADIGELFKYAGKEITENYIIREISRLYELQGEAVSRKHIEVIVRQMFSRRKIKEAGDTLFSPGDVVEESELLKENLKIKALGKTEAKAEKVVMGITEVSLTRKSFLSAASFQHTTKILINASVRGYTDDLSGLKENVIIGRLIPAGTGFPGSRKSKIFDKLK